MFQSTHPHEVRQGLPPISSALVAFQSTHPHEVRRARLLPAEYFIVFQSTHPHEVRLGRPYHSSQSARFQSTHPHEVRRYDNQCHSLCMLSFNPRTHTRCDYRYIHILKVYNECFNPRTHTRCDRYVICVAVCYRFVSIHAPTRGATESKRLYSEIEDSFNPRTHTRCDFSPRCTNVPVWSFNPRTHTRCDKTYIDKHPWDKEFQSTHPHEVRPSTSV